MLASKVECSTSTRKTAQIALRDAGLYEQFRAIIHEGGQAMRILDQHGTVHVDEVDDDRGGHGRPEVERGGLRQILLDSLPPETIRWGSAVTSARNLGNGRHEITLADGHRACDLLVGADGAWSRVRPLVSGATPTYTGISFVELDLLDAEARHPEAARLVGGGMLFSLGRRQGLLSATGNPTAACTSTPRCAPPRSGCPASTSPTRRLPRQLSWPNSPTGHPS